MSRTHDGLAHALMADPVAYAHQLSVLHNAVLSGDANAAEPRSLISDSWRRSLAAHVDPDAHHPPVVYDDSGIAAHRDAHPLAACLPVLRQTLLSVADEAMHVMIVTDAEGHILWREGSVPVQRLADEVGLMAGTRWAEESIGTNAMGTTLAVDRPVQVHSAEHLVRTYHNWTCAAAPIHDPATGRMIGAVDLSGPLQTIHPSTVALVSAAARLAEGQLSAGGGERDERLRERNMPYLRRLHGQPGALLTPDGRVLAAEPAGKLPYRVDVSSDHLVLPDGRQAMVEPLPQGYLLRIPTPTARTAPAPRVSMAFLGEGQPRVWVNGDEVPLALRHAEILALLAMYPRGLNADQLALHLYGDAGNPITVRAEIYRLRAELGRKVIGGKPYRLTADVDADFLSVRNALRDGDVARATTSYGGELLPSSESPTLRQERDEQLAALRNAVLECESVQPLWQFAQTEPGASDLEVLEVLLDRLDTGDSRHSWAEARLRSVAEDYS
jgi:hypothetical protein